MLEPSFASGFINLKLFCQIAERFTLLPRHQDLESSHPEVLWSKGQIRRPLFISHRWDDVDHPDPKGWQLQALLKLGAHYNFTSGDEWIWYDYMSLPQKPRSPEENKTFTAGLANIREVVARSENVTLVSKNLDSESDDLALMEKRAWIAFELYIARENGRRFLPLFEHRGADVEYGRNTQYNLDAVVRSLSTRAPLDSKEIFQCWFEKQGYKCTNGSDISFVSKLLYKSLTETPPDVERKATFTFDNTVCMHVSDVSRLAFRSTTGLSHIYPNVHMTVEGYKPDSARLHLRFRRRPPLPKLDEWQSIKAAELENRLVDMQTLRSVLYPGIQFEISSDGKAARATIASE